MTHRTTLQLLRQGLDDLYVASSDMELDMRSHGDNPWKNDATGYNFSLCEVFAAEVSELMQYAREETASNPTPRNVRELAKCERLLCAWIERFEPSFAPSPPVLH